MNLRTNSISVVRCWTFGFPNMISRYKCLSFAQSSAWSGSWTVGFFRCRCNDWITSKSFNQEYTI